MKEPCHVRTQLCSDGTLRMWRWPMRLGEEYYGKEVEMTETKVKLSEESREYLLAKEERVKRADEEIQRKRFMCKETGLNVIGE